MYAAAEVMRDEFDDDEFDEPPEEEEDEEDEWNDDDDDSENDARRDIDILVVFVVFVVFVVAGSAVRPGGSRASAAVFLHRRKSLPWFSWTSRLGVAAAEGCIFFVVFPLWNDTPLVLFVAVIVLFIIVPLLFLLTHMTLSLQFTKYNI